MRGAFGYNPARIAHRCRERRPAALPRAGSARSRLGAHPFFATGVTKDPIPFLSPSDRSEIDRRLRASLDSDVALIGQIAEHIIGNGGKRLRPALVLHASRACGYTGTDHYLLGAVMEMIHTATLLHDDVVDESDLRRGHATANAEFGNAASVLVGDFLYSRAFQMMVALGSVRVLEILSQATNVVAKGEVLQLMNAGNPDIDESVYLGVIQRKTAKLFEAAAQLGAVLGGADAEREAALAAYGLHLGIAFQLIDDVLDYSGDLEEIGKNLGDDLAEGKMTLPLIRAMEVGGPEDAALVRSAVTGGRITEFGPVMDVLVRTRSLEYTRDRAAREAAAAVTLAETLPVSPHRQTLLELASFAARRTF